MRSKRNSKRKQSRKYSRRSTRKSRNYEYIPIAYKSLGIRAPFGAWTIIKKSEFNRLKKQGKLYL